MAIFNTAIKPLLLREGFDKITDVPGDFGGLTKFGISQKAYPKLNIRELTAEIAASIYKRDYWDSIEGDKIQNQEIAEAIFDAAVNHGVSRSVIIVQQTLNVPHITVDGIFGNKTLNDLNNRISTTPIEILLYQLVLNRLRFYSNVVTKNKTQLKFLHGWLNRALEMAHV